VREQIREELTRERTQQLAEEAAQAYLAAIEQQGSDPAELAATHGGTWMPAAWITRTDETVPTEVLSAAFAMPKTTGAPQREIIALANGGQAVIVLTGVEPGEPTSMTQAERDQRLEQLADQTAQAELGGYVGNVRETATVRIPDEILNPPLF
jgi:hypothetical protein